MTRNHRAMSKCFRYLKQVHMFEPFVAEFCRIASIPRKKFLRVFRQRVENEQSRTEAGTFFIPSDMLKRSNISFKWVDTSQGEHFWQDIYNNIRHIEKVRNGTA